MERGRERIYAKVDKLKSDARDRVVFFALAEEEEEEVEE